MTDKDKVKNIMAFLSILFGEKWECMKEIIDMPPDYIIEKFERYVLSTRPGSDWGLHPQLRTQVFDIYCEKWNISKTEYL